MQGEREKRLPLFNPQQEAQVETVHAGSAQMTVLGSPLATQAGFCHCKLAYSRFGVAGAVGSLFWDGRFSFGFGEAPVAAPGLWLLFELEVIGRDKLAALNAARVVRDARLERPNWLGPWWFVMLIAPKRTFAYRSGTRKREYDRRSRS
jgi:hypothetical protein